MCAVRRGEAMTLAVGRYQVVAFACKRKGFAGCELEVEKRLFVGIENAECGAVENMEHIVVFMGVYCRGLTGLQRKLPDDDFVVFE